MRNTFKKVFLLKQIARHLRHFSLSQGGQAAVMLALSLPVLLGGVGVATDFSLYSMKKTTLQAAADQAAIAGARELSLARQDNETIAATAATIVRAYVNNDSLNLKVKTEVMNEDNKVKVGVSEIWTPFFAHFIDSGVTPISAEATAGLFGESKLCVLALSPTGTGAVSMIDQSSLDAQGCTVYSNSSHASSVYMGGSASIEAQHMCTVGGVTDNGSLNAGKVVTDCPALADPLKSRTGLKVGACQFTKLIYLTGKHELQPGVYCGGLTIAGDAVVTLSPNGEYIIKDGPLVVTDKATLQGEDVGIYFTGIFGVLNFMKNATIDLSGRETGPMAGMLLFDDPSIKSLLRVHNISATNARNLTGTIYLPNANLLVDPAATVGEDSAYTAIVVRRLIVQGGPTLVLNTNYNETAVPVPQGIRSSADVMLID